jgi:predicted DNA binding CopG/RHH family protein
MVLDWDQAYVEHIARQRLPVVRGATKPVTIRMPVADVEVAREIAERQGVPYQTYIKGLLHKALQRERKAS